MGKIEDKAKELVASAARKTLSGAKSGAKKGAAGAWKKLTGPKVIKTTHGTDARSLEMTEYESDNLVRAQAQVTKVLTVVYALEASGGRVEGSLRAKLRSAKYELTKVSEGLVLRVKCGSQDEANVVAAAMADLVVEDASCVSRAKIDGQTVHVTLDLAPA